MCVSWNVTPANYDDGDDDDDDDDDDNNNNNSNSNNIKTVQKCGGEPHHLTISS